jgi:hypothetical protein
LRRKSHEDTQRDNDYAYQNANEALFATGAGFARVSDETADQPMEFWKAEAIGANTIIRELRELLHEARAYVQSFAAITKHPTAPADAMNLAERIVSALNRRQVETTAPPRVPPRSFDIEGHMGLYPSDEVSAPEKTCDHYWHTDGYCVKCEMPQQKARGDE